MARRRFRTRLAMILSLALVAMGCRAIGRLPGIDPSDYAYLTNGCSFTQVYQFRVPQVETSALEAMADLGYRKIDRQEADGEVVIRAKTYDHRPARVTIRPRNQMTELTVRVGLGDEFVSDALIQRVALNFGTLPRTVIPLEPTLGRRSDPLPPPPPPQAQELFVVPAEPLAPAPISVESPGAALEFPPPPPG